jgi:SWIM/SEC-C metal-binding protein
MVFKMKQETLFKIGSLGYPVKIRVRRYERGEMIYHKARQLGIDVVFTVNKEEPENFKQITNVIDRNEFADWPNTIERNQKCPCGSQTKYKKCCQNRHASLSALLKILDHPFTHRVSPLEKLMAS